MSTTTHSPTGLNGDRIAQRARDTIERVSERYQQQAREEPASAYDPSFWQNLQNTLVTLATKYRVVLEAKNHEQASEFRDIEEISIRTAVEEFRGRIQDDPYKIQNPELWNDFRQTVFDTSIAHFEIA